ncbi:MAG: transcriptional repressor [Bacteroidaceae bacterium]|nr:transcriptional repressor [Bacteroidaceae bacterium]
MENSDYTKVAVAKFQEYLKAHHLRKTPERFAIVETVCSYDGHFKLEDLHERMIESRHFVVSRATLYNNINILVDSGIVTRHRLGEMAEYEKNVLGGNSHFHMVCTECGKIKEFHNDKLYKCLLAIKVGKFSVKGYTIYVNGLCAKCSNALKRTQKNERKKVL